MKSYERLLPRVKTMGITALLLGLVLACPAQVAAATNTETSEAVYVVDVVAKVIHVKVTIRQTNNQPPKTEYLACTKYRLEQYQSYESYQSWEYKYSIWHPGYWYYGVFYYGWNEPIYGWVTRWHYVTRTRTVPYADLCPQTTNYYVGSWSGAIPASATSVKATVNGRATSVSLNSIYSTAGSKYRNVVAKAARLFFGESRTTVLRYDIPSGAPRSAASTRVNAAYLGLCPIGYGRTGGYVEVQIPKPYVVTNSSTWTATDGGTYTKLTQRSGTDMYQILSCIQASNKDSYVATNTVAGSGKAIRIEGWPGDPKWLEEVARFVTKNATPLERFTGLQLTSAAGDLRVREASSMLELSGGQYSGRYDPKTNTIWVSEQYDEETVVHELSHVWFNVSMPKWMREGLASWTSKRLLKSGSSYGPYNPLERGGGLAESDWCFLFDPLKVFPKEKTDLESWGKASSFETSSSIAESARYQLSCATVAEMLDRFDDAERLRFYQRYVNDAGNSAFGPDVTANSVTSELRAVADFVAIATDSSTPGKIDAWLARIANGALVGLKGDPALAARDRKSTLTAYIHLASTMRSLGWDDTDAPLGLRQRLADGQYDVADHIAQLQVIFDVPLIFYTRQEMAASGARSYVRGLGITDEVRVADTMRVIQSSDSALASVGRDWWKDRTVLDRLGAVLLGDPTTLVDQSLSALASGDLKALEDKSSSAMRSAQWAGLTGTLLVLLVISGIVWAVVRKRNGLALVPQAAVNPLRRVRARANVMEGIKIGTKVGGLLSFKRRIKRASAVRKRSEKQ